VDFRASNARVAARPQAMGSRTKHVLKAVVQDSGRKPVLITGNNIDVTPSLMDYTNKKIGKVVDKLGGIVTKVDAHLSVIKNPRVEAAHVAEVTVFAKGTVIRAGEASDNMYASIDLVTDIMARKLRKYKERNVSQKRSRPSYSDLGEGIEELPEPEESVEASGDEEEDVDSYGEDGLPVVDMSIVKRKSFPMPPCTVEDAIIALEYIDHDFYVFRNSESGEVNVVYKRNHGGLGHIQPERD
jgi:putative sigma-54 modulation protein